MQVHVAKADLWSMPVDAVVNPANSLGIMGGGIGGSLRRQGGDVIQQAAMAVAPIDATSRRARSTLTPGASRPIMRMWWPHSALSNGVLGR